LAESLISELKRSNVFKVGLTYLVLAWVVVQSTLAATEVPFEIKVDNWVLKGDLSLPDSKPRAFIFMFHKIGGNRNVYKGMARKFVRLGYATLRLDLRGHGKSTNLSSYDHKNPYNKEVLIKTHRDIVAAYKTIMSDPRFERLPVGIVGASYSGQHAILASDQTGFADAYIMLAPGSINEDSMKTVEASGQKWLFVRTDIEMDFFDEMFLAIRKISPSSEQWLIPGEGHASDMLFSRPLLESRLVFWMDTAIIGQP
jgi:dienelactone hydrolase